MGGWQINGILTLRTGDPVTMAGTSCHGVWSTCMPDYAAGYTGNGNRRLPADALPTSGSIPAHYTVAYSNQAAGIATGGNVGLQIDDRSAHEDAGLLDLQEFQS